MCALYLLQVEKTGATASSQWLRTKGASLTSTDAKTLELPGTLDIRTVPELKESLVAMLAVSPDLRVIGSDVAIATTPGLQLLMSAASSAEKQGGSLVLVDPSQTLQAAFTDIGCSSLITDWSKADG